MLLIEANGNSVRADYEKLVNRNLRVVASREHGIRFRKDKTELMAMQC